MRYYLSTTAKFASQCLENQIFGATQSNWLVNIDLDDILFLSQFNYQSQKIYGPFKINKTLFYDKKIIYPDQKFYYRIGFKPQTSKVINETDLYLKGLNDNRIDFASQLISLIQQNKHLHTISLIQEEGIF